MADEKVQSGLTTLDNTSLEQATFGVRGMTCANCSLRVEQGLSRLAGVSKANVNLALERASVAYDPEATTLDVIVSEVRDMGYDVTTDKAHVNIVGMTCANCVNRIEKGLNALPGVKATVNLGTESAFVEYVPALTDLDEVT